MNRFHLTKLGTQCWNCSTKFMGTYKFPEPIWSINIFQDKILNQTSNIVTEEGVQNLARLAAIDLNAASQKVSIEEIAKDVNVILNCATLLQEAACENQARSHYNRAVPLTSLRSDIGEVPTAQVSEAIVQNSDQTYKDYIALPKIKDL